VYKRLILLTGLWLLGLALPAFAHHSFQAVYDMNAPITVEGTVTKLEWMNPHIYYYLDVSQADGSVVNYRIEGGTPNTLYRRGWRKDDMKAGDTIKVEGFMARDGTNNLAGRRVTLADGRRVFSGSTDGGPTEADLGQ
jgi:hypothetical protein